jgi:hypothetical protein
VDTTPRRARRLRLARSAADGSAPSPHSHPSRYVWTTCGPCATNVNGNVSSPLHATMDPLVAPFLLNRDMPPRAGHAGIGMSGGLGINNSSLLDRNDRPVGLRLALPMIFNAVTGLGCVRAVGFPSLPVAWMTLRGSRRRASRNRCVDLARGLLDCVQRALSRGCLANGGCRGRSAAAQKPGKSENSEEAQARDTCVLRRLCLYRHVRTSSLRVDATVAAWPAARVAIMRRAEASTRGTSGFVSTRYFPAATSPRRRSCPQRSCGA